MLKNAPSVLDNFKIAIGPSEVFTLGPWLAARQFLKSLESQNEIQFVSGIKVLLYGPVAENYIDFRTGDAIVLGLTGYSPLSFDSGKIETRINGIRKSGQLFLHGMFDIAFDIDTDIVCRESETLPQHPNALTFLAAVADGQIAESYYLTDEPVTKTTTENLPFPINDKSALIRYCEKTQKKVSELVFENEKAAMPMTMIRITAKNICTVMQESICNGCGKPITDYSSWAESIRRGGNSFSYTLDWIGCFALAIEKENSLMGRVVAAPTNATAGIVSTVLQYYRVFYNDRDTDIIRFLLTAGQIGDLFKTTCSNYALAIAMASAGLTELLGGSVTEVISASETAIEQNQNQDTNAIGAIKAIMAAQTAVKQNI